MTRNALVNSSLLGNVWQSYYLNCLCLAVFVRMVRILHISFKCFGNAYSNEFFCDYPVYLKCEQPYESAEPLFGYF